VGSADSQDKLDTSAATHVLMQPEDDRLLCISLLDIRVGVEIIFAPLDRLEQHVFCAVDLERNRAELRRERGSDD